MFIKDKRYIAPKGLKEIEVLHDKYGSPYVVTKEAVTLETFGGFTPTTIRYEIADSDGKYIGVLLLNSSGKPSEAEMEYRIENTSNRGKGIMSAIVSIATRDVYDVGILDNQPIVYEGKDTLSHIDNIFLNIDFNNDSSRKVAQKNGFEVADNGYIFNLSRERFEEHKIEQTAMGDRQEDLPAQ